MLKAIGALLEMLNRATGNYQSRVKDGLIGTGDGLVKTLKSKKLKTTKKKQLTDHYLKQWTANRRKLK